jgi:N6-L-threonylcarbamoyladenine synthase
LSKKGRNQEIVFPCADLANSYDFSFSGVKTAVYYLAERMKTKARLPVEQIAYSFQKSVVASLVKKTIDACLKTNIKTLIVGGGVAANSALREELTRQGSNHKIDVFIPDLPLCTDNAAMVAGLGFHFVGSQK